MSFLETLESGVPFGANNLPNANANGVDPRPYVTNPGYVGPPTGTNTTYFFTAFGLVLMVMGLAGWIGDLRHGR